MIYSVRRFSDNDNGLRKLAIGAAALAGGLYAGKKGYLGAGLQKSINTGWARVGKSVGSDSMMLSGAKGVGEASAAKIANRKAANNIQWSNEAKKKHADNISSVYLNKLKGIKRTPSSPKTQTAPINSTPSPKTSTAPINSTPPPKTQNISSSSSIYDGEGGGFFV